MKEERLLEVYKELSTVALVGAGLPSSCLSVVDPQCISHMTGISDEEFLASASEANLLELRGHIHQIKEAAEFFQQSVKELYQKRDDLEFKMCNYRNTSGKAVSHIRDYVEDEMVENTFEDMEASAPLPILEGDMD